MSLQSQILNPFNTMEIVLDAIREIIPYELAVILSKETGNRLKVQYAKGELVEQKLSDYEIELSRRPDLDNVMEEGQVRLADDDPGSPDTYEGVIDLPAGHSCMLVPLSIGNTTLGLMTLDHRECDIFTPGRVQAAGTLSKLIALALAQAIANDNLQTEKETLLLERNSLISEAKIMIEGLVGKSQNWNHVLEKIKLVAPADSAVLITGETGTGKEKVARSIHSLSGRAAKQFIALNCSALNVNLAESELFGHEKGAYTGATTQRKGRFELADGGTLFLDEIADLPAEIQPKLLRALQEGKFERVGGEKTISADVRIICATNADLQERVRLGRFREDLFYRLNVFPIMLPPLRARKEDIVLLAGYFLEKISTKPGMKNVSLSEQALEHLLNKRWPGNIRELQNTLERAAILSGGSIILKNHLFFDANPNDENQISESNIVESFDSEVKDIIGRALKISSGKIYGKDGAAALLKLKPTTLQSKMKKLGLID